MGENKRIIFKILLVGSACVGKSQIINRFALNTFSSYYRPTIGADFLTKTLKQEEKSILMQLWDTSEQRGNFERFLPLLLRGTDAVILVYSCDNYKSLEDLKVIFEEIKNYSLEPTFAVFANKSDSNARQVSYEQGLQFAYSIGAIFIEVSAMTGENIEEAFSSILNKCLSSLDTEYIKKEIICRSPK